MMPRQLPFRTSPALSKVIVGLICAITVADALAADGLRELDLSLKSLVYDPFTQKLYGTATNSLLQIDPASGQILQSFTLGTNLSRLELGSARGLWVAIQGEQAVRRFDLERLSAGEKIAIFGPVFDIAPSPSEPFTVAVSTFAPAVLPKTAVIKNGTLLPDQPRPYNGSGFLAMQGDFVYEHLDLSPYAANVAALLRMRIGPNGLFLESPLPVVGLGGFGRIQIQGTNLYSATGAVFDTPSLATLPGYSPAAGRARTFAINNEAGSIFFLSLAGSSATESSWILDRFDLVSHDLTGRLYLPPLDPYTLSQRADSVAWNLVTWSTNRLAFQTLTKLCLLESEKIFLPADVQVSQSLPPATIPFGAPVNVTVTVTNNGPGTALNVTVTNFTSQAIYLRNNSGAGSNQFVVNLAPFLQTRLPASRSRPSPRCPVPSMFKASSVRVEKRISPIIPTS